jgi:hypothetical protein
VLRRTLFLALACLSIQAATLTVTSTADSGSGSLRDAVANAAAGDTITFNLSYPATIALTTGQIQISKALTISGPGPAKLTIRGNNSSPVLKVFFSGGKTPVTISGLTITGGSSFLGGGIYEGDAALTVDNCVLSNNSAVSGGGIGSQGGTLTISNSIISGNSGEEGGGVFVEFDTSAATLTDTTVSGNTGTAGGGIFNESALTLIRSTISGNTASVRGGAIFNGLFANSSMMNSTIANNSAPSGAGGGIITYGRGSAVSAITISSSTISGNSGGGIVSGSSTTPGLATLKNTILANNLSAGTPANCAVTEHGSIVSLGYNLSDDVTCSSSLGMPGDLNSIPAGLDPAGLQNNGGPTGTVALAPGSVAINWIPVAPVNQCTLADGVTPVATDQRGALRPQGSGCDIGSYERGLEFSSLTAKLNLSGLVNAASFDLNATLTLGGFSNGINPVTEDVALSVGTYSVTIPAGSFHQLTNGSKLGSWVYAGTIGGVNLSVQIGPLGGQQYQFKASGSPVNLVGTGTPIPVGIVIGDDLGKMTI